MRIIPLMWCHSQFNRPWVAWPPARTRTTRTSGMCAIPTPSTSRHLPLRAVLLLRLLRSLLHLHSLHLHLLQSHLFIQNLLLLQSLLEYQLMQILLQSLRLLQSLLLHSQLPPMPMTTKATMVTILKGIAGSFGRGRRGIGIGVREHSIVEQLSTKRPCMYIKIRWSSAYAERRSAQRANLHALRFCIRPQSFKVASKPSAAFLPAPTAPLLASWVTRED